MAVALRIRLASAAPLTRKPLRAQAFSLGKKVAQGREHGYR